MVRNRIHPAGHARTLHHPVDDQSRRRRGGAHVAAEPALHPQEAWEREREELARAANHHRAVAEQLADQVATLEAIQKSTEREYFERLKEITAEVDRCLLRARAEWVHEMARMAGGSKWELPAFLKVEGP